MWVFLNSIYGNPFRFPHINPKDWDATISVNKKNRREGINIMIALFEEITKFIECSCEIAV